MARDMDLALNCVEKAKNDHSRGFGRCARKLLESFSWNDCGWGILPRVTTFFLWSLCVRWTMVVMVVNIAAFVLIKCQVPCHILHFFSAHRDIFVTVDQWSNLRHWRSCCALCGGAGVFFFELWDKNEESIIWKVLAHLCNYLSVYLFIYLFILPIYLYNI